MLSKAELSEPVVFSDRRGNENEPHVLMLHSVCCRLWGTVPEQIKKALFILAVLQAVRHIGW